MNSDIGTFFENSCISIPNPKIERTSHYEMIVITDMKTIQIICSYFSILRIWKKKFFIVFLLTFDLAQQYLCDISAEYPIVLCDKIF